MKKIGYLLLIVGFLAGALTAVVDEEKIRWSYFVSALVAGAVGLAFVRIGERMESRHEEKLTSNMQKLETALSEIVKNITQLNSEKDSINTYYIRNRIDELFADDLETFVEARESIAHTHNLSAYADVMSSFAAGERYLNRVWSASADGYIDEVNEYLDRAQEQFAESRQKVLQLKAVTSPPV